jgi:hypothetical protein
LAGQFCAWGWDFYSPTGKEISHFLLGRDVS